MNGLVIAYNLVFGRFYGKFVAEAINFPRNANLVLRVYIFKQKGAISFTNSKHHSIDNCSFIQYNTIKHKSMVLYEKRHLNHKTKRDF